MKFKQGDQVAYVPGHADGNLNHRDVEFGFVTGYSPMGAVVCRFWRSKKSLRLRTTANSEACGEDDLVHHKLHPQSVIDLMLKNLGYKVYK